MPITEEGFREREEQFLLGDTLQIAFYNGSWTADTDALMRDVIATEVYRATIPPGDITVTWEDTLNELQHTIASTFTVVTGFSYNRYGLIKGSAVPSEGSPAIPGTTFTSTTTATLTGTPASFNLQVGDRVIFNLQESEISNINGNDITVNDPIFPASGTDIIYNGTGVFIFAKLINPTQTVPDGILLPV